MSRKQFPRHSSRLFRHEQKLPVRRKLNSIWLVDPPAGTHNLFEVEIFKAPVSQGSSCLATLGFVAESLWDPFGIPLGFKKSFGAEKPFGAAATQSAAGACSSIGLSPQTHRNLNLFVPD